MRSILASDVLRTKKNLRDYCRVPRSGLPRQRLPVLMIYGPSFHNDHLRSTLSSRTRPPSKIKTCMHSAVTKRALSNMTAPSFDRSADNLLNSGFRLSVYMFTRSAAQERRNRGIWSTPPWNPSQWPQREHAWPRTSMMKSAHAE